MRHAGQVLRRLGSETLQGCDGPPLHTTDAANPLVNALKELQEAMHWVTDEFRELSQQMAISVVMLAMSLVCGGGLPFSRGWAKMGNAAAVACWEVSSSTC